MEKTFPGMWQRWLRSQSVGIGWCPEYGYKLRETHPSDSGWNRARKPLQRINIGDWVIVALSNNKVGRIGEVVSKEIEDDEWNPLVEPITDLLPYGEMGRRINVRWDLEAGPINRNEIVELPIDKRFNQGEKRGTIKEIGSLKVEDLKDVMKDERNWVGMLTKFKYEKSISDYLAAYPYQLEEGLQPHPSNKIREKKFLDNTRLDVLLIDRDNIPVVVECKQNAPTTGDIDQIKRYIDQLKNEIRSVDRIRGILVHGGSKKLNPKVSNYADKEEIEVVQYKVRVDFNHSY